MQRRIGSKVLVSLGLAGGLMLGGLGGVSHAAPAITAKLTANPASYSGKCPATIKFDGEITVRGITRGPMKVVYEFIRSDGAKDSSPKTLTFLKDGSLPVSGTWTLGGETLPTYSGWKAVKVTAPTPVESNKAAFSVKCAAEEKKPAAADDFKLDATKFEEKPLRKIPARLSAPQLELVKKFQATPSVNIVKTDLVCQIKAYYDLNHTKPVQSTGPNAGNYHISQQQSPPRPLPYYVFFEVTVKNEGLVNAAPLVTNKVNFTSVPMFFPPKQFITAPETLVPGEAAEYKYYWGPFGPSTTILNNRSITVVGAADFPPHVTEDSEANNLCNYQLKFVYP